jgi:TetR/AcrR family transcriptional regulator, cholesterol catabolism regulator
VTDTKPKPRGRPRTNHEERQHEIVDIAARLFAEQGYHATSVSDLADAVGLHRGGLYHYIGSKENVLFYIHERFIEPLLEEAYAIEARAQAPDETLRALAAALMSDIAEYRDQVTVFLHEWRTVAASSDDERVVKVRAARSEFEAVVARTLRRGTEQGIFEIDEPKLAVLGFLGMINYTYQWYRTGADFEAGQVASAFCDFFLNGVRARS